MPCLAAERRQPERRRRWIEDGIGMWLEGKDRVRHPCRARRPASGRDYDAVAGMEAVEVADGDRGAAIGTLGALVSEDAHGRETIPGIGRTDSVALRRESGRFPCAATETRCGATAP